VTVTARGWRRGLARTGTGYALDGIGTAGGMSLSRTWFFSNQYFIPHRLMLLARMIDRETARDLQRDFRITAAEWRALAYICTTGVSSAAQICEAFEVDRAEVSRAVARLLDARLIQRGKSRDQDNRLTLTPTPRGEDLHDRIKSRRREYFDWILQDLDEAERAALDQMLGKIAERVDQNRSDRAGDMKAAQVAGASMAK
jgi:DNA-binding MarR family transcriptional regulator